MMTIRTVGAALLVFTFVTAAVCAGDAPPPKMMARVWHGKTKTARAAEYYAYLNEAGVEKIKAIEGNVGVQIFRRTNGDITEFTVISYWTSLDAIKKFAGEEIEKTHPLPRDPEFLIDPEPTVKHFEVVQNDWKR